MMTSPPPEFVGIIFRLIACHSKISTAVRNRSKAEALEAINESITVNAELLNIIPNLNTKMKVLTPKEMDELKKGLAELLS